MRRGSAEVSKRGRNPSPAEGVCGPGYRAIDRHRLYDTNPATGRQVRLAVVVLTYNSSNGNNCAFTLKRYRVGKKRPVFGGFLSVSLAARPLSDATVDGDSGEFRYFAGPVYVPARHRCVQWGGSATLLLPRNFEPRGYFESASRAAGGTAAEPPSSGECERALRQPRSATTSSLPSMHSSSSA